MSAFSNDIVKDWVENKNMFSSISDTKNVLLSTKTPKTPKTPKTLYIKTPLSDSFLKNILPVISPETNFISIFDKFKWITGTIDGTTVYYPLNINSLKVEELTIEDRDILNTKQCKQKVEEQEEEQEKQKEQKDKQQDKHDSNFSKYVKQKKLEKSQL
jgi:hypothetical protein